MALTDNPTFLGSVDQVFLVERLGGPQHPYNLLDRFPDEVYNKAPETHLVKFLYALLGPMGVGQLREVYFKARVALEEQGFELVDLDNFYGDPFKFGRILEEFYNEDLTGLLPRDTWDEIRAKDERYRSRAIDFVNGARAGNTPFGMRLIARSGLGHEVEIIENYKYLFDSHSDEPVGLNYFGQTYNTEEFIVLPRRETPRDEVQVVTISGDPTSGSLQLIFKGESTSGIRSDAPAQSQDYLILAGTDNASNPINAIRISKYVTTTLTISAVSATGTVLVKDAFGATLETHTTGDGTDIAGIIAAINANSTRIVADFSYPNTTPVPVTLGDTTDQVFVSDSVQGALEGLSSIGPGNVEVTGGPGPLNPWLIRFTGLLSNQDVPALDSVATLFGGSSPEVTISDEQSGIESVDETVVIPARDQYHLQQAIDRIKPVNTLPTLNRGEGLRSRQNWGASFASSEFSELVRYVTGSTAVTWPALDSLHWIERSIEKEAPRIHQDGSHHYRGFHNVSAISAYTDLALNDPSYLLDKDILAAYKSEHLGPFSPAQRTLFAHLRGRDEFNTADQTLADYAEPLLVTTVTDTTSGPVQLVEGVYPLDYGRLPGVPQIKYANDQMWASLERTSGSEYIEIDLGSSKPVNYLAFEIAQKPITMEIAYDLLDQSPRRNWKMVTPAPGVSFPDRTVFSPDQTIWQFCEFHFTDAVENFPVTRFLRLRLDRRLSDFQPFLYDDVRKVQEPWSIEIRNLRVGRNIAD